MIKETIDNILLSGMRIEELAIRLGVSSNTIFRWKSGSRLPRPHRWEKLQQIEKEVADGS